MEKKWKEEVTSLQGCMTTAAKKTYLPSRFTDEPGPMSNCRKITDTETNRSIIIGLCDYHGARKILSTFFGEGN